MGLFCAPLICSCVDDQRDLFQEPEKLPKESFFDFNMNQNLAIDIDYGFKEDYVVLFEIYGLTRNFLGVTICSFL